MNYRYKKRQIVVEAFQLTRETRIDNQDWPVWLHQAWNGERGVEGSLYPTEVSTRDGTLSIFTLEGEHLVSFDDWIIQGIEGEIYPCKPSVFEASYELA